MATSRAIKCDNCGKVELMDMYMQDDLAIEGAPQNWIRLFVHFPRRWAWVATDEAIDKKAWYDLCSVSCSTSVLYGLDK